MKLFLKKVFEHYIKEERFFTIHSQCKFYYLSFIDKIFYIKSTIFAIKFKNINKFHLLSNIL